MSIKSTSPHVIHMLKGESLESKHTAFGTVGTVFTGYGIEAVWVSKQDEEIDPEWFSQSTVDLIVVLQGQLKVEFEAEGEASHVLGCGDLLVLPPNVRCRAYRWPREAGDATIFFAVYPMEGSKGAH